jgi:hypothetical protein
MQQFREREGEGVVDYHLKRPNSPLKADWVVIHPLKAFRNGQIKVERWFNHSKKPVEWSTLVLRVVE